MKIIFVSAWLWLESESQFLTLNDIEEKMQNLSGEMYVFGTNHMKRKLKEKYWGNIIFAEISGQKKAACFNNKAIMRQEMSEKSHKSNVEDGANEIFVIKTLGFEMNRVFVSM